MTAAEAPQRSSTEGTRRSLRTEALESRPVNLDGFVEEWPEVGMVALDSAFDPKPSVRVENGVIVEMDGIARADFDFIDQFIADKAIDIETTESSMAIPAVQIARMLVAHWFDNRNATSEDARTAVPYGVKALLATRRSFAHDYVSPAVVTP